MNLESIKEYLSVFGTLLGFLCTFLVFLKNKIKNKRLKRIVEKTEKITKTIIPTIIEAEQFVEYTGIEKKEYVMTKLQEYAISFGIKFDSKSLSDRVDELIQLTKSVNVKEASINEKNIIDEISNNKIELEIKKVISKLRG